ncbi:uncharacterized protein [Temnothorax nylanderi]|uniref:uncharacterized protein n=1 Tax=Temnothorax nylanderi TaxID=102681 RepID=UPI003A87B848
MDSIFYHINQQLMSSHFIANAYDNFIGENSTGITRVRIEKYLSTLATFWTRFNKQHDELLTKISELELVERLSALSHSYFSEQIQSDTHVCYLAVVEKIKALLATERPVVASSSLNQSFDRSIVANSSTIQSLEQSMAAGSLSTQAQNKDISRTNDTQGQNARLPYIKIPNFNGDPTKWLSYRDLFTSLVLNKTHLTDVEKLQYLKTSLTDTAAHLIENTTLTSENLTRAWNSLLSFYDNPRLQVNTVLQAIFNLKAMTKESASELEHLYTTFIQHYRTLQTLRRPVETWDDMIVFMITQRLDSESVKAWENRLGSTKVPPSWRDLDEFLITRLFTLKAYEKSRGGKTGWKPQMATAKAHFQGKSGDSSSSEASNCPICREKHYIAQCPKYVDETVAQKLALVAKHKLCYNCLGKHRVANCRVTKRCKTCSRKHHTTIHRVDTSSGEDANLESKTQSNPAVTEQE